jgi:hypothetical protein
MHTIASDQGFAFAAETSVFLNKRPAKLGHKRSLAFATKRTACVVACYVFQLTLVCG